MLTSYVKKVPLKILLLGKFFPLIEKLFPKIAVREATKMFFKPIRFKVPQSELELRNKANISYHQTTSNTIAVLQWISKEDAPFVLLMHGWASRATHFKKFIEYLLANGYNVICPEAPAHGLSTGTRTDIIGFSESLAIAHKLVKPKYWVCHSMGGSSAMYCINNHNIAPKHLSIIATPAIGEEILDVFASRLGASKKIIPAMLDTIQEVYKGKELRDFTAEEIIKKLPTDISLNLIYDKADIDAPAHQGERLKELFPTADLLITENYGHIKIIKELDVLKHCQKFWD